MNQAHCLPERINLERRRPPLWLWLLLAHQKVLTMIHNMQHLRGSDSVQVLRAKMLCQRRLLESDQRSCALLMDVKINPKEKEYVSGMVQRGNYAAAKGARVLLKAGKCASGMGQEGKFVVVMDVKINLKEEVCAEGMGQSLFAAQ